MRAPIRNVIAAFVLVLSSATVLVALSSQAENSSDFVSHYVAGELLISHPAELYSIAAQYRLQHQTVAHDNYMIWAHPAPEALLFVPFGLLPYSSAFNLWAAVNLLLIALICNLLRWQFAPLSSSERYGILSVFMIPVFVGLVQGQDHLLTLLFYVFAYRELQSQRDYVSGLWLGLALIRFQITLPVLLLFAAARRWRVLLGAATGGAIGIVLWVAIGGRHFAALYVGTLKILWSDTPPDAMGRMPNLRGLVFSLLPGSPHREGIVLALSVGCLLAGIAFCAALRLHPERRSTELLLCFAVTLSIATGSHGFLYDLTLLGLSALVIARNCPGSSKLIWAIAAVEALATLSVRRVYVLVPILLIAAIRIATALRRSAHPCESEGDDVTRIRAVPIVRP